MYEKPPPREIQDIIEFPRSQEYKFNRIRFYNKLAEDQERRKNKYQKAIKKIISYEVGEKVLLKNRELPSTLEGITKTLLLLYTGPYLIVKNNNNNTYVLKDVNSNKVKGTYNQLSIKKYLVE